MRWVLFVALLGCGRVGFDTSGYGDGELIAYYPLDDTSFAGGAVDASGNGNAAGCSACPAPTTGRIGGAAMFDGSTQFLSIPSTLDLDTPTGFTVAAWAFRMSNAGGMVIVGKPYGTDVANSWSLFIPLTATLYLTLYTEATGSVALESTTGANVWQHVVGTWDGSTARLFVDGSEGNRIAITNIVFDDHPFLIGADADGGAVQFFFFGLIDDVRIYNRALSPIEVAALANPRCRLTPELGSVDPTYTCHVSRARPRPRSRASGSTASRSRRRTQ